MEDRRYFLGQDGTMGFTYDVILPRKMRPPEFMKYITPIMKKLKGFVQAFEDSFAFKTPEDQRAAKKIYREKFGLWQKAQ